jgi:hypothetical protein
VRNFGPAPFFPVAAALMALAVAGGLTQQGWRDFGATTPADAPADPPHPPEPPHRPEAAPDDFAAAPDAATDNFVSAADIPASRASAETGDHGAPLTPPALPALPATERNW